MTTDNSTNNNNLKTKTLNKTMETGKVKFFNETKGYGFITNDKTKKDIFFHVTELQFEDVQDDDQVSYEEKEGKKGLNAAKIKLLSN